MDYLGALILVAFAVLVTASDLEVSVNCRCIKNNAPLSHLSIEF